MYHNPVMLKESIEALEIIADGVYVDATFGGGGHSKEILKQLGGKGKLIAIDQDEEALKNASSDEKLKLIHGNFRYLKNYIEYLNIGKLNGILADLGVSSHHFDTANRGFSYRFSGKLDMRMNQNSETDAISIINSYSEADLCDIFWKYGELQGARKLAKNIIKNRENSTIETVDELVNIVNEIFPENRRIKTLSQVFQALRIEVNDELKALEEFLLASVDVLADGGNLVVISYHSLEDRMVKRIMKSGNLQGIVEKDMYGKPLTPFKVISRKVIVPCEDEIRENSRAKAAKLRIAKRIINGN